MTEQAYIAYARETCDLLDEFDAPQCDCTFAHRFKQFDTDPYTAWELLILHTRPCTSQDKIDRALLRWNKWCDLTGELPWITVTRARAFMAYREAKSVREKRCTMNSGEFSDQAKGLSHVFRVQFSILGYLMRTEKSAGILAHLKCARNHTIQDPKELIQCLTESKRLELDPATHDAHCANLARTDEVNRLTESQAREVSKFFLRKESTVGFRELYAWNLSVRLGLRARSELYKAKLWQIASVTRPFEVAGYTPEVPMQIDTYHIDRSKARVRMRPEAVAYIPHRDPMVCAQWGEMVYVIQRYDIDDESLPDFNGNWRDVRLFDVCENTHHMHIKDAYADIKSTYYHTGQASRVLAYERMQKDPYLHKTDVNMYMRHTSDSGRHYETHASPGVLKVHAGTPSTSEHYVRQFSVAPPQSLIDLLMIKQQQCVKTIDSSNPNGKYAQQLLNRWLGGRALFLCGAALIEQELPHLNIFKEWPVFKHPDYRPFADRVLATTERVQVHHGPETFKMVIEEQAKQIMRLQTEKMQLQLKYDRDMNAMRHHHQLLNERLQRAEIALQHGKVGIARSQSVRVHPYTPTVNAVVSVQWAPSALSLIHI